MASLRCHTSVYNPVPAKWVLRLVLSRYSEQRTPPLPAKLYARCHGLDGAPGCFSENGAQCRMGHRAGGCWCLLSAHSLWIRLCCVLSHGARAAAAHHCWSNPWNATPPPSCWLTFVILFLCLIDCEELLQTLKQWGDIFRLGIIQIRDDGVKPGQTGCKEKSKESINKRANEASLTNDPTLGVERIFTEDTFRHKTENICGYHFQEETGSLTKWP